MKPQSEFRTHPVHRAAQAMELRDRFQRVYDTPPVPLMPGDLCIEKAGIVRFIHAPVLLFIRTLDPFNKQDEEIILDWHRHNRSDRLDCLIAFLSDDAKTVIIEPHTECYLTHYDPSDPVFAESGEEQPA